MKLGFVSAILPELELPEVLGTARELGYSCVEIMCWPKGRAERRYAGVTHIDVASADPCGVRELCAEAGVEISGLGYYPNLLSPDPVEAETSLAHLRCVIATASKLGLSTVNTFIGRDWTKSVDANWPAFEAIWPDLVSYAESHAVRIGIENCPMLFSADEWPGGKNLAHAPAVWRRMFEAIPSPSFGLNYDPSHLVWQGMDPIEPIWEFAPRIFHVHAKDVRVDAHRLNDEGILAFPLQYHTPKLPGLGQVNWGRFFSVLGDTGYDGPVCVEVEDRAYEGSLSRRTAALAQSLAYLRQFVA